jgi:hypothetical protein
LACLVLAQVKLIADIGTNPELIKVDVSDVLLHHFLKHYDAMGVKEFILHGNDFLIHEIKSNYQNSFNIKFIPISKDTFLKYREIDVQKYLKLKHTGKLDLFYQQVPDDKNCKLWILQNDLKKKYISGDELCFILDLDEFVDLSAKELKLINESDIEYCRGQLIDMTGHTDGELVSLTKDASIFKQLNERVNITKGIAGRVLLKIILTRGHLEHACGHHRLYQLSNHSKKNWHKAFNVFHCKYFQQNIKGGLGPWGIKEEEFFKRRKL